MSYTRTEDGPEGPAAAGCLIIIALCIAGWAIYHFHWFHGLLNWMGWKSWTVVIVYLVLLVFGSLIAPVVRILAVIAGVLALTYAAYVLFEHGHWIWGLVCLTPWPILAMGLFRLGGNNEDEKPSSTESTSKQAGHTSTSETAQQHTSDLERNTQAADQGEPAAQQKLAMIYMQGDGVPQNYIEACKWLILAKSRSKAGSNIHESVSSALESIETKMTKSQVAQAQRAATDWFNDHS